MNKETKGRRKDVCLFNNALNTLHILWFYGYCYISCGVLTETKNISMSPL